jgi:hypothetical protein
MNGGGSEQVFLYTFFLLSFLSKTNYRTALLGNSFLYWKLKFGQKCLAIFHTKKGFYKIEQDGKFKNVQLYNFCVQFCMHSHP